MHIKVDTSDFNEFKHVLKSLHKSAFPIAVRQTINDAAKDMKNRTMPITFTRGPVGGNCSAPLQAGIRTHIIPIRTPGGSSFTSKTITPRRTRTRISRRRSPSG